MFAIISRRLDKISLRKQGTQTNYRISTRPLAESEQTVKKQKRKFSR